MVSRGGCWFCPNKKIKELVHTRANYPEIWGELREMSRTPNIVGVNFKFGKSFSEVECQMDKFEIYTKMQRTLFD